MTIFETVKIPFWDNIYILFYLYKYILNYVVIQPGAPGTNIV
jgi:hypothetical protein